jgi:hypothetical protein
MALTQKSLFLYNLQVTANNQSLDFKAASGGPTLQATVPIGYYSLTDLCTAVVKAMAAVDAVNTYTCTANRSFSGGTQNRVTIATSGAFLSLLFSSGPRAASNIAALLGFTATDKTGATTYTGTSSCGTTLQPVWWGKDYRDPNMLRTNFGSLNISANGTKEAITYQIQQFIQVRFDYEPYSAVANSWQPFLTWAIQQQPFEFTPQITDPNTVYNVTLESTDAAQDGLGYELVEMTADGLPFLYSTGTLVMRLKVG